MKASLSSSHARVTAQPLPYRYDALEPFGIPEEQLRDHYLKHHCAYADALEGLVAQESSLCAIVDKQHFAGKKAVLLHNQQHQKKLQQQQQIRGYSAPIDNSALTAASSPLTSSSAIVRPLTPAEALMLRTERGTQVANLASMVVNHDFFWRCMRGGSNTTDGKTSKGETEGGNTPAAVGSDNNEQTATTTIIHVGPETTSFSLRQKHPSLALLIGRVEHDFGSVRALMRTFETAAMSLFGSGWVWLAWSRERERLVVMTTRDSVNPLTIGNNSNGNKSSALSAGGGSPAAATTAVTHDKAVRDATFVPLIGCDMWEHAFLVHGATAEGSSSSSDANAEKRRYLSKFWAAADWGFAATNYEELLWTSPTKNKTVAMVKTAVAATDAPPAAEKGDNIKTTLQPRL